MKALAFLLTTVLLQQSVAPDALPQLLQQIVREVEERQRGDLAPVQLDVSTWLGEEPDATRLSQLHRIADALGRGVVDVREELVCPLGWSAYDECRLPEGISALRVSQISVPSDRAELWFRLIYNERSSGRVRNPGFQAIFERQDSTASAWELQTIRLRIMP